MAKDLMRMSVRRNGWVLLLLGTIPAISAAEMLADPTKPPTEFSERSGTAVAQVNDLQSIIISPTRRAAIINGQTVELGAKVGDVRLIEISESGVVLQGARGLQVLMLFPNVKINKKAVLSAMEEDVKSPARKEKLVNKPGNQTGKKEEK